MSRPAPRRPVNVYVGVLTDGREWHAYHEQAGKLVDDTQHMINPTKPDGIALLFWLEGVLASRQGVPPTPNEIKARLGAPVPPTPSIAPR